MGNSGATAAKRNTTYAQTYATASSAVPNPTAAQVSATSAAQVATTGASNVTPYGFTTAAQANAIVTNLNALVTTVTALVTQLNAVQADELVDRQVLNSIIDDLQALGLVK